jgi:hypothetical protein
MQLNRRQRRKQRPACRAKPGLSGFGGAHRMVVSNARIRFRPGACQTSVSSVASCSFPNRCGQAGVSVSCRACHCRIAMNLFSRPQLAHSALCIHHSAFCLPPPPPSLRMQNRRAGTDARPCLFLRRYPGAKAAASRHRSAGVNSTIPCQARTNSWPARCSWPAGSRYRNLCCSG